MKKNYLLLVLFAVTLIANTRAQEVIYQDDFETGYTDGADLVTVNSWQVFAADTKIVKTVNSEGNGADGSDWFGQISTGAFTTLQRVYPLTAGETYEFKLKYRRTVTTSGALKLLVRKPSTAAGQVQSEEGTSGVYAELSTSITADSSENYGFRIIQTFGTANFDFDDVSIVCTTCSTASVAKNDAFEFAMYPNPANDIITFKTQEELSSIKVYNIIGKEVLFLNELNQQKTVNVSKFEKGVYIMKIEAKNGSLVSRKFIKN